MKIICSLLFFTLSLTAQVYEKTSNGWVLTKDSIEIKSKVSKLISLPYKKLYKEKIIHTDSVSLRISDSVIYVYEKKK